MEALLTDTFIRRQLYLNMYSNLQKIPWQLPYKLCSFTFPWLSGHSCKHLWPDTFRVSGLTLALFLGFHTHRLHKMKSYSPLNLYFNKWTSNCCSSQWILYQFQLLLFFHRLYIYIVSLLVVTIIDSLYYNCRVDSLHVSIIPIAMLAWVVFSLYGHPCQTGWRVDARWRLLIAQVQVGVG